MTDAALRIHLVRHAETLFNVRHQLQGWCDSPLTPRGHKQVEALGEWFRSVPLTAAFSSDLTRTRTTTAGALSTHPGVVPTFMPELREWNFGAWEGQPNPALWEPLFESRGLRYGTEGHWKQLTVDGPGAVLDLIAASDPSGMAESAAEVDERMAVAAEAILAVGSGNVLVVTHGAVLQSLAPHLVPGARVAPGYPNCGVTTVTIDGTTATVSGVDAHCSLAGGWSEPLLLP